MKKNKRYIFLIVFLLAFFFLMYMLIGKENVRKKKLEVTIAVGEDTIFQLRNNSWVYNISSESVNWEKFQVFLDGKEAGEYYVWHDDRFYIFNDKKEAVNYNDSFLGVKANFDVKVKEFKTDYLDADETVDNYLKSKKIKTNSKLKVKSKVSVDLDNDNKNETIYVLTNSFVEETNPDYTFAYVFMKKDDNIYDIYSFKEKNNFSNGVMPYVNSIVDIDDDGKYEMIITCAKYSMEKPIQTIYKFENNKVYKLISNQ